MALFIVEAGVGTDMATSYVDIPFADSYLGENWAPSLNDKEQALIDASEYLDARWGAALKGVPFNSVQTLAFPRKLMTDRFNQPVSGIPRDIKRAVCRYAVQALADNLYAPTEKQVDKIKSKSTTIGPITTSVSFVDTSSSDGSIGWLAFPLADQLVAQFLEVKTGQRQAMVMR